MQILDDITSEARQKHTVLINDGSAVVLELCYMPTQLGWFLEASHEASGWAANGLRITANSNILNQWRDILPFGLMCWTEDGQEPMLPEDFLTGRASLAVLTAEETEEIAAAESR